MPSISEHHRRLRLSTLVGAATFCLLLLIGITGIGVGVYCGITNRISMSECAFLVMASAMTAIAFGWLVVAFLRRVFVVRSVRFPDEHEMKIRTYRGDLLLSNLRQSATRIMADGPWMTVEFQVQGRKFLISANDFTNAEYLNQELLRRLTQAGHGDSGVPPPHPN